MKFNPADITEGRTLYEAQIELERKLLRQGFEKDILQSADAFDRISQGKNTIIDLPKGKQVFLETFNSVQKFIYEIVESESQKARKSSYYTVLMEPQIIMYQKELTKKDVYAGYQLKFENPLSLLTYFITRELTRLMVVEELMLTVFCRKIANPFMNAFHVFGEASDDALKGVIQLIRTYVETPHCKYFQANTHKEGVIINLKEQFNNLKITKEELLSTIQENSASFKPMLVQPINHNNLLDQTGGYLELKSPVLKNPEFDEVRQIPFNSTNDEFFESINAMQSTQWKVNKEFYDWLKECTHPEVSKHFNINIKDLQIKHNKLTRELNHKILLKQREGAKAKYESTTTTAEEKKESYLIASLNAYDEADKLAEELHLASSALGKARGWNDTTSDADFYQEFDHFYHPLFADNRGRIYTYNTTLSFQGSSLAKVLVSTKATQRLTETGLYELQVLLGGMFDGYDKKSPTVRYNHVQSVLEGITKCITHQDYSIIEQLDEDEILKALSIMFTIHNHNIDSTYETGIIAYIDATSSAIQLQAIVQKCSKAASLTNLLPNSTDDLPDAYMAVAQNCKDMCTEISNQTDEELFATLAVFYLENDSTKLTYMNLNNK